MQHTRVLRGVLLLLGTALVILGLWRVFDPLGFHAYNGIDHPGGAALLSEARGAGGLAMGTGVMVLAGAIWPRLAFTASLVAVATFWSYAAGRLVGVAVDGNPGPMVVQGLVSELVLGAIAAATFWKHRQHGSDTP